MRAASVQGGHGSLLVRGMGELDLELFLADEGAGVTSAADARRPVLRTAGPGKQLKAKGQILTLRAEEAAECGLATVVSGLSDLGKRLTGGAWHEPTRRPWNATNHVIAAQRHRDREQEEDHRRFLARQAAVEGLRPQWDAIEARIASLASRAAAAAEAVARLSRQCEGELRQFRPNK